MRHLTALVLLAACAPKAPPPAVAVPRPVTVLPLREIDPVEPLLLTGSVTSWKEADVAAEVSGRVAFVVETSTHLKGRWLDAGEVRAEGDVLARIDTRSYRIAADAAAANLVVAKEKLKTAQTELTKVLPADIEAARAEHERAKAEYVRNKGAFDKGALPEFDLIKSLADRDVRAANYEQAKAAVDTKNAEIAALEAQVKQAEQQVEDAAYDLERCVIYAPFDGDVSLVHVEAGGYARAGQPVAHLVMMDPINVDVGVSQERAARIKRGDQVRLFLPGRDDPVPGSIYEVSTVADPDTRTFRVSVITRNLRRDGFMPGDPHARLPRIRDYMFLMRQDEADPTSSYWVEANRCLRKDDQGYFIWADPTRKQADSRSVGAVLTLRKIRVKPGDEYRNFQGLYLARTLVDAGGLTHGALVALDVPDGLEDGAQVAVARPRWELRPGELVGVLLDSAPPARGLYVPMDAVKPVDDANGVVFRHVDGKAARTPVRLLGRVEDLVRVEGEGLAAGAEIIIDYTHFLQDGEEVKVAGRRELSR